jgi:hypothetical protein
MATTKPAPTVLANNVTLTASAADYTSDIFDIQDGYQAGIGIKITNGATGPTVAAVAQVWWSFDNSNWYKLGGAFQSSLGNNVVSSWPVPLPMFAKYAKVVAGSNTGQNVTLRVEGVEVSEVS